ncbi:purine-nucleoside phosphorylase [Jutongia hominis]|uniref:Purine nucleoside phosphorylase n=1 Tax=Jutongia hominis TaxID=2763664 RepID=A0ABR7MWC7_9FIRM|nr:purine-nucleoside phosphorylase [Jutongia hominis]MBC8558100.1 purine-nucleoside phosphorylase [Jutongia hominis]
MDQRYQKLMDCYACFQKKISFVPQVALVLGSGLGDYANDIKVVAELDYKEIDGFPTSTVQGHEGKYIFGYVGTVPVVCMKGRVHYYEGYDISDVVLPIRLMKLMGAKVLFLTNASGGINTEFRAGDLMLIQDQISDFVPSPLIGANMEELGTRFPDMSEIYDKKLQEIIKKTAAVNDIPLEQGVYIQLTGPNFESPAEVRMCRILGADAVGMSTACEAVAANHMRMHICGISCIANMACGITPNPLTHKEVQEAADRVAPRFKKLVTKSIINIAKEIPLDE